MTEPADRDGMRRSALVAGVLIMAAGTMFLLHDRGDTRGVWSRAAPTTPSTVETREPAPAPAPVPPDSASGAPPAFPVTITQKDKKLRDEMRARIYRAFGQVLPERRGTAPQAVATPPAPDPFADAGPLDKDYIHERVKQDFYPMARTCYESALAENPKLAGKVIVNFEIVGDESVGGIVESAELADGGTLSDPDLVECLRQSMLSMSFRPPPHGGRVTVAYPFTFSPDGPDGGH